MRCPFCPRTGKWVRILWIYSAVFERSASRKGLCMKLANASCQVSQTSIRRLTIRKTNSESDLNKLCRISGAMPKLKIIYLCDLSTASMPNGLSGSSGSVMPDQYWTESSITRQTWKLFGQIVSASFLVKYRAHPMPMCSAISGKANIVAVFGPNRL